LCCAYFFKVPDRQSRRVSLAFWAGGEMHRHEFLTTTQLGAVLEMVKNQGGSVIEMENTSN